MPHILLAEDDPSTRDCMIELLSRAGHRVDAASSGVEAVNLYLTSLRHRDYFDLLLLDGAMSPGSGFRVAEEVRGNRDDVPIVIITNYDQDDLVIGEGRAAFSHAAFWPKVKVMDCLPEKVNEFLHEQSH